MVDSDNISNLPDAAKKTNKSEAKMEFSGPEQSDLVDVRAINLAFLTVLGSGAGERLRRSLPPNLQPAAEALSAVQVQRLATVPFLLVSLNETDEDYWSEIARGRPVRDLFTPSHNAADPICRIATAAVGFLWQLARRNPYAARVVSGATLNWCEQLAEQALLHVLECVVDDYRILVPRLAQDEVFWHRLFGAGVSSSNAVRRAAHLSALQAVLTKASAAPVQRLRTAACYSSVPSKVLSRDS